MMITDHKIMALIGLVIASAVFFWLLGGFAYAVDWPLTDFFNFNFETFADGNLDGQNGWIAETGYTIGSDNTYYYGKNLRMSWLTASYKIATYDLVGGTQSTGSESIIFYIYAVDGGGQTVYSLYNETDTVTIMYILFQNQGGTTWRLENAGGTNMFGSNTLQEGHWLKLIYTINYDAPEATLEAVDETQTSWGVYTYTSFAGYLTGVGKLFINNFNADTYLEGFGVPALQPDIYAVDPASGSTITDLESTFTFGWDDIENYDILNIGFNNRLTGLSSDYLTYDISDLTGVSTSISFDAFGIDKNGDWFFQGYLSTTTAEVYGGSAFTGRYITNTTDDLAYTDDYYFIFNIAGFETIFEMPDFEGWYAINSTRYDSPTDMFVGITGLFGPIFSKIGEFGQRIDNYFDLTEAYASGYDFGKSIPIFGYYLEQVHFFIGGFPFMKWLLIILLFFVGIFLFRFVLKFIPTLGGS